MPYSLQAGWRL